MRLWTLHPRYLDVRGLTALWREALLARAVLTGKTRGYVNHPQLIRFRETGHPVESIQAYLRHVHTESLRRGYSFDASKLEAGIDPRPIVEHSGQLGFEWDHLKAKLAVRAPELLETYATIHRPQPHPLFTLIDGPKQSWEKG